MRAIIKKVKSGKMKGQFRFVLKANNGEAIASSETYKNRKDMEDTLNKYFSQFLWVDKTK